MPSATTPYISRNPGDLVAAEDWNGVQVKIKEDIAGQVGAAKEEIKASGVDRAGNAEQFASKTPKDWTDELDQRYAPKVHDHEGTSSYRRFMKRVKRDQLVFLEHKLGRLPLVDLYELEPIEVDAAAKVPAPAPGTAPVGSGRPGGVTPNSAVGSTRPVTVARAKLPRFILYYHHEELERLLPGEIVEAYPELLRELGIPFWQLLDEYQVQYEDDDSLGDVINDFFAAFFKPPLVDHMEHKTTAWIDQHREKTVAELKQRDEWPDIRWLFIPFRLPAGSERVKAVIPGAEPDTSVEGRIIPRIDIIHLSYDKLAVMAGDLGTEIVNDQPQPRPFIDLMILLRS
jgi:hypothetical protein